jgi:hypothetical protein
MTDMPSPLWLLGAVLLAAVLFATVMLVNPNGYGDRLWCNDARIRSAESVRECLATDGCKTTPDDLGHMHRIEKRCSQFNGGADRG